MQLKIAIIVVALALVSRSIAAPIIGGEGSVKLLRVAYQCSTEKDDKNERVEAPGEGIDPERPRDGPGSSWSPEGWHGSDPEVPPTWLDSPPPSQSPSDPIVGPPQTANA
jgi:hypothetical protein